MEAAGQAHDGAIEQVLALRWTTVLADAGAGEDEKSMRIRDIEDNARAESQIRQDYTGRYPIELLQNAHDACDDDGVVGHAWVHVTPTALLVGNQGASFTADRVDALLRLGSSSKRRSDDPAHHTIGYKGIGFSSVFEVSDTPQIISTETAFCFDRTAAAAAVRHYLGDVERVAIRRYPFLLNPADWSDDASAVESMRHDGAVTVVRLPFRSGIDEELVRIAVSETLKPEALLFMHSLDGLTLDLDTRQRWTRATRTVGTNQVHRLEGPEPREWLVRSTSLPVAKDAVERLDDDLWRDVSELRCAVALPWADDAPDPDRGPQQVSVYFPTDDELGHSLLVHGDFFVDSSRRHIEATGAGGALSLAVAGGVAALIAELARDLANHGNELLACIARRHANSGFGGLLSATIDQALRSTDFLCRSTGDELARPAEVKRAGTHFGDDAELMVSMLEDANDVVRVGDDRGVGQWLSDLGCPALDASEIARRLAPARSGADYETALAAIQRFEERPNVRSVRSILRERPIVQDVGGNWCPPAAVVLAAGDGPDLPEAVRPTQLLPPRAPDQLGFVTDTLGVETLTDEIALRRLLDALTEQQFGVSDEERLQVLEYLRQLLDASPATVAGESTRIAELVSLPVSTAAGNEPGWAIAGRAYFREADVPGASAEAVLGALEAPEFLDAARLPDAEDWVKVCTKLGVARDPRMVPVSISCRSGGTAWDANDVQREWVRLVNDAGALKCPDGHPYTDRTLRGAALDRLHEALDQVDEVGAERLATFLSQQGEPFGPKCEAGCDGSAHARRSWNEAPRLQEFLLHRSPWIPVIEPDGSAGRSRIGDAWFDVNSPGIQSLVPVALISDAAASNLGLTRGDDPGRAAIERALDSARVRYPDLSEAPGDIHDGLAMLLTLLDAAIKGGADEEGSCPWLPASKLGSPTWSSEPLVADLFHGASLEADVLPPGQWVGLRKAYGLNRISDVASVEIEWERPAEAVPAALEQSTRVRLTALLAAQGLGLAEVAASLGSVVEVQCAEVLLEVTIPDRVPVLVPRRCYLRRGTDETPPELYITVTQGDRDILDVAEAVAELVGSARNQSLIALALSMGDAVIQHEGITDAQMAQAEQAIAKYAGATGHQPVPRRVPRHERHEEPRDEPVEREDEPLESGPVDRGAADGTGSEALSEDWVVSPEDLRGLEEGWPESPSSSSRRSQPPSGDRAGAGGAPDTSLSDDSVVEEVDVDRVTFEPHPERPTDPGRRDRRSPRDLQSPGTEWKRPNEADRRTAESNAMGIVQRYLEHQRGMSVSDVSNRNLGWDLEATLDGETWLVEVKGVTGRPTSFILTENERRAAQQHSNFQIALVGHAEDSGGVIHILSDVELHLDEENLLPMSWSVNGWNAWSSVEYWRWTEG